MDLPRPAAAVQKRRRRRIVLAAIGLVALVLITAGLARLEPAVPTVDRTTVWIDTVRRGEMLRQVRGSGTLVPEEILWIPTLNPGRVQRIFALPGAAVHADTVLLELSNPEVEKGAFDAEWQLRGAEAELTNLIVQLQVQRLQQQAIVASAQAGYTSARLDADVNEELAQDRLVSALTVKQSITKAEELAKLLAIERERLEMSPRAAQAQRAVQEAKVEQLHAQLQLRRRQLDSLKIRAGIDGVLQRLGDGAPLQVGQQLAAGTSVARVANSARLKAEIKINETEARDVQVGQTVSIDTHNGLLAGRVARIDPAVENGTVTVDVALEGALPKGARPDLSVEGIIELERLDDVLHVGRPAHGSREGSISLFKVQTNGRIAVRVPVKLGRSSVSTIEVVEGLQAGDQVLLNEMNAWDGHDRIRLK